MTSYAEGWQASDMSLRDYFAAQALGGLLSNETELLEKGIPVARNPEHMAKAAYAFADMMLKTREGK